MTKRLLTVGHSYVVAANRRLAHEMARQGSGQWDVTAVAPRRFHGDLRPLAVEPIEQEADRLELLDVRLDRSPHLMWYRDLGRVLRGPWDVVHCWEEPYVLAGAQIARAVPDRSRFVVATFQNLAKSYPWPFSAFERSTMRRADGWIAFGHTVHETLASRPGYAATPSRVLSPGVDVDRFRPDSSIRCRMLERLGWPSTDRVVGFLGRFVPQKGVRVLLDALRLIRGPWRALFVGGGPLEHELQSFADEYRGRVHIDTGARHEDVPSWLNAMDLLCVPSQSTPQWREQFGRVLIEGMACGVPIVASHTGEIPHVLDDAGVVAPESDSRHWADQIERVLEDQALRDELRQRGIERAHSRFAWPVVAREHLTFFETIMAGGAA